jgi:hypothetical protein
MVLLRLVIGLDNWIRSMKLNKIKKKVLSSVEATNITINILFLEVLFMVVVYEKVYI